MLVLVSAPLSVNKLLQPRHWQHLAFQQHEAVPWAGLTSTVLSKGPFSPWGGLKQMKLFTYILKINLGLPEFKWALFLSYGGFFSGNIYYKHCKFNLIFSDLVWLLKNPT
jgi:hypothetical protein